jgi:hypothetical protein
VEQRRSRTWATVLIEARFVPVLLARIGAELAGRYTRPH